MEDHPSKEGGLLIGTLCPEGSGLANDGVPLAFPYAGNPHRTTTVVVTGAPAFEALTSNLGMPQ